MSDSSVWDNFVQCVEAAGMEAVKRTNTHWQIKGDLLVNYWPFAKRGATAHVSGTKSGLRNVSLSQAIKMARSAPPVGGYRGKRDRRSGGYSKTKAKMLRKNNKCWVCGKKLTQRTATLDHVIPLARGGQDNHNNMKLACEPCNRKRGSAMPELSDNTEHNEENQ